MKYVFLFLFACFVCTNLQAQIGLGGKPHASAALDVPSTDKAFYPPRMSSSQRKNIANPQAGAFVYDTDKGTFYLFNGQSWSPLMVTDPSTIPPFSYTALDGTQDAGFGNSVSISGNYAIVGAAEAPITVNGTTRTRQGAAYIFMRTSGGWTQQAKLIASDGAAEDLFGQGVAIYGDYAIVGAYSDDVNTNTNQGSAYIFIRNGTTWTQQARLTASDGTANDYFGGLVAIYGDYAIVNGGDDDITVNGTTNIDQGSAFVFVRNGTTWTEQAKLIASDGASAAYFGSSVSINENYALVGAYNASIVVNGNTNGAQGAAYVFVRNGTTWTQQAKLIAADGATSDRFGGSVSINGAYALIGSTDDDNRGSAYVFIRDGTTWTQQAKLIAPDGGFQDYFGVAVSLSGNYAIVGAFLDDLANTDQGSAYIFVRNGSTWTFARKVSDNSPAVSFFGARVSLDDGTFIIGAPAYMNDMGKIAISTVD